jgi:hypothetical protein
MFFSCSGVKGSSVAGAIFVGGLGPTVPLLISLALTWVMLLGLADIPLGLPGIVGEGAGACACAEGNGFIIKLAVDDITKRAEIAIDSIIFLRDFIASKLYKLDIYKDVESKNIHSRSDENIKYR